MRKMLLTPICVLGLMGGETLLAVPACAQSTPEVVDSYPKQRLKARAAARKAAGKNVAPEMVLINPGQGTLGSPSSEFKRARFENPMRETAINYAFEVGKYEVTFNDWDRCVSAGGCGGHRPDDGGWGRGNRPVINISFDDAQKYIKWLNKTTGDNYRLLSEAEWEYVARAGLESPFGHGYEITAQVANFDGKAPYGSTQTGAYHRKTQPVGQYAPNAFGVHDMHGNVYEWVEDCWNPDHSAAPGTGEARKDGDCEYRVMKGGSWVTHGYQMRASKRLRYTQDYRYDDYGFRIARTLGDE